MSTRERYFICREDNHNKYWAVELSPNGLTASVRNGRLGSPRGAVQPPKSFSGTYAADQFVFTKIREKQAKGYQEVDAKRFELLSTQAAIVGTQNKCGDLGWIERQGDKWVRVPDERLLQPDYEPALMVDLETKEPVGGRNQFLLVFTPDGSYEALRDGKGAVFGLTLHRVQAGHSLHKIVEKVEQSIGRAFA